MGDKIIRKMSEEETDRLLKEEFFEEADLIEKALFSDDLENSSENDRKETEEETEAAYQKLLSKLKETGIYREEETVRESKIISDVFPEIKEEEPASGEKTDTGTNSGKVAELREFTGENTKSAARSRRMHGIARAAAIGVVCVLGVFAASMTGEANRRYFINSVKYLAGDDTRMVIDNDSNELDSGDEYEARAEIEKSLGIIVPEFWYRPPYFEFYNYWVDAEAGIADIQYNYKNYRVLLNMRKKSARSNSGNFSLHGEKKYSIVLEDEDILVDIIEIKDLKDTASTYIAQWSRDDVFFQFSGKINKEDMLKIIKEIRY